MSPVQMTNGLFGGWRTKEFTGLMEYLKSSGISISGFNVQRSGNSFRRVLSEIGTEYKIDTLLYHDLEARYGSLQAFGACPHAPIKFSNGIIQLLKNRFRV
jgi:hypothetical protein